MFTRGGGVT
jgi:hypothetical protein